MSAGARQQFMLRQSGMAGILGIILFVVGLFLGSGTFAATGVTLPDFEPPMLTAPSVVQLKIGNILTDLITPLLFLFVFQSFRVWMHQNGYFLTEWVYAVSLLGIGIWLLAGVILVFILPAASSLADKFTFSEDDFFNMLTSFASGLLDGAFVLLSIGYIGYGDFLRQRGSYWGRQTLFIAITTILIILLGPYERINPFGIYAYGAPIVAVFGMSAALLVQADKLAGTLPTQ